MNDADGFVSGTALKFSKMAALNDVFAIVGLKHLSKGDRKRSGASARVEDYIEKIPALRKAFEHRPDILALYDGLTRGYQKDWARYVYNVQTEAARKNA